ncbi:hypothetical protein I8752_19520 [Nostocaceae cyanobacterium CENA369]|uniref:Uncharacterized protein n=1 Tax=Dendronalium phyllosphericum CENA369 TaxID=1725256 RepID=A0A8J7LGQ8_9NOST|nr:hypothetical protein [Dendronalium phyllosphericum]MBH8575164.1 hypothetical protein [Dendronalium phyllosphericum CENA369]
MIAQSLKATGFLLSTQHSALLTHHSALSTQHSALSTPNSSLCYFVIKKVLDV